jgi:REP element-mobilizing transposase RayT
MPRKPLIRTPLFPYHVTQQVNNREWFPLESGALWSLFAEALFEIDILFGVKIHAFVLMSNHYHLLISCPNEDLGIVMSRFVREVTKRHNRKSGRIGHLFRTRYKWSVIESTTYAGHALRYVYQNPVRAGIISNDRILDYSPSTLPETVGLRRPSLRLYPMELAYIPECPLDLVKWVQQRSSREQDEAITKAMRRQRFELPRDRQTGFQIHLDDPAFLTR